MMIKKTIIIIAVFHGFETFDHTGNDGGNAATLIKNRFEYFFCLN